MKGFSIIKIGQVALLATLPLLTLGQGQPLESVQKSYSDYVHRTLQEKMFVHLDRPLYVVGETMWFKAYCVEGTSHRALDVSKVGYLEVLDKDGNPVAQTKLALNQGKGEGNLLLPATLASGTYAVRCYTHWMKNFSPDYYFETAITLLNPFVRPETQTGASQVASANDVQFFPEGGSLVGGLESKVAFRAIGPEGKGIDFKGTLVNQQNDTLLRFQPVRFGMGTFVFTPSDGDTYRAVVQDEAGKADTYPLPKIQNQGYVMQVRDSTQQLIKITVLARQENSGSGSVSLLAHTRLGAAQAESRSLKNGKTVFVVDKGTLGEGITHFTIFDQANRPVAERLYFKRPTQPLEIAASLDRRDYTTREKVHLDLTALAAAPATLSASVYLLDSLPAPEQPTLDSYLLLTSDLKGTVESPAYYFENPNAKTDEALDLVMLTHGWTRFRWEDIAAGAKPVYRYLPEHGGHFVQGKIVNTLTGQPAAKISTYLSTPSQQAKLFVAQSDALGNIRFETKKLYDSQDIIVQTNTQQDSTYRFEIGSPYADRVSARRWLQYPLDRKNSAQLLTRSINMQTLNAFTTRPQVPSAAVGVDSLAFFGKPDEKYFLDAFTRFPTMEEVMREYVPGVFVRKRQGKFHFRVVDKVTPQGGVFTQDPLILLDGVPVFDTDKIMAFDPLKVKKLEVVDALYYLGPVSFGGITSYTTYKGDLADFELDPRALVLSYQFAQSKKEFYAPRYDPTTRASRLPDFRNLLHWVPTLIPNAQGKTSLDFYTSDQTGTYRVVVQGLTPTGQAGSTQLTFEVKPEVRQ